MTGVELLVLHSNTCNQLSSGLFKMFPTNYLFTNVSENTTKDHDFAPKLRILSKLMSGVVYGEFIRVLKLL